MCAWASVYPHAISTTEDRNYVQQDGGRTYNTRETSAVNRVFILRHYRAYGGPEPPPLDHQGIDDGILEKASETRYFYDGKWLRLTGAD